MIIDKYSIVIQLVAKKLDRILVNELWEEVFPTAYAFLANRTSQIMLRVVLSFSLTRKRGSHHSSSTTSYSKTRTFSP